MRTCNPRWCLGIRVACAAFRTWTLSTGAEPMTSPPEQSAENPKWEEERARFEVLQAVQAFAGSDCAAVVTGRELLAAVDLPCERLYQAITCLSDLGYLTYLGAGPRVCVTHAGIEYVEKEANRRRSVRA